MPHCKVTGPSCCCQTKKPVIKPPAKTICCCCTDQHNEYQSECSAKKKLCQTGETSPYNLCVMSKQCLNDEQEEDEQDLKDINLNYSIR